jgi:hypothetical protein
MTRSKLQLLSMSPLPLVPFALALVLLLGCAATPTPSHPAASASTEPQGPSSAPPLAEAPPTTPLLARYSGPPRLAAGAPATITITLENVSAAPETLNLFVLGVPSLALEVRDPQGHTLLPMSPPVPPLQMETTALAPGATRTFSLTLDAFSPPLPRGHYTVRLHDPRVPGAPFAFVVE